MPNFQPEAGDSQKHFHYEDGYPAVANFISKDPDGETYVFRKFANLTARKLLHLESELIEFERKQHELDQKAATSPDAELRSSLRSWERLRQNAAMRKDEQERLKLANDIDIKLGRYRKKSPLSPRYVLK